MQPPQAVSITLRHIHHQPGRLLPPAVCCCCCSLHTCALKSAQLRLCRPVLCHSLTYACFLPGVHFWERAVSSPIQQRSYTCNACNCSASIQQHIAPALRYNSKYPAFTHNRSAAPSLRPGHCSCTAPDNTQQLGCTLTACCWLMAAAQVVSKVCHQLLRLRLACAKSSLMQCRRKPLGYPVSTYLWGWWWGWRGWRRWWWHRLRHNTQHTRYTGASQLTL